MYIYRLVLRAENKTSDIEIYMYIYVYMYMYIYIYIYIYRLVLRAENKTSDEQFLRDNTALALQVFPLSFFLLLFLSFADSFSFLFLSD